MLQDQETKKIEIQKIENIIVKEEKKHVVLMSDLANLSDKALKLSAEYHDLIFKAKVIIFLFLIIIIFIDIINFKFQNEDIQLPLLEDSLPLESLYELFESVEYEERDSQEFLNLYEMEHRLKFNYDCLERDLNDNGDYSELRLIYADKLEDLSKKLTKKTSTHRVRIYIFIICYQLKTKISRDKKSFF